MRTALHAVIATVLTLPGCGSRHDEPLMSTIYVPAGNFRARTVCSRRFQRACKLSYAPPIGKSRHRVLMWLDAFWTDADLVRLDDYQACRSAGACSAFAAPVAPQLEDDTCGYNQLARVPWADAEAYCHWRGARLPTPDEYERMARWTDGRRWADGRAPSGSEVCARRPSPEGIRNLNVTGQWTTTATDGAAVRMGFVGSTGYSEPDLATATSAFRCVRSAYPTPTPGLASVAADQSDPWLLGGPDG